MGLPNNDEIKGKFDQVKGGLKEKAGQLFDDDTLEEKGEAERAGGEVRESFGKAKRKVGEVIEDVGKAVGR